jgi:hypothetical protein
VRLLRLFGDPLLLYQRERVFMTLVVLFPASF